MKTLLLDVDGVLVDIANPVHKAAESILQRQLTLPENWSHHAFHLAMDMSSTERELFDKAMIFDDNIGWKLDLYPGAQDFVTEITKSHDVCFVTTHWSGMRHWVTARENLLKTYFPDIDIVFTHSKFRVSGDLLVDDQPDHIMSARCKGVLFDRPWNRGFRTNRRATDYEHLLQTLELV
jgi:5'(3')-deoxyribonucleotidase